MFKRELKVFERLKDELFIHHYGKYVLIKGNTFAGSYDTERAAYNAGLAKFGNVSFFISLIEKSDADFISERTELEKMIAETSIDDVIDLSSLKARLAVVNSKISQKQIGSGSGFELNMRQPLKDKLDVMFDQQIEFMKLLQEKRNFPQFPVDLSTKDGQKLVKDIVHHVQDELHEATQHLKNAKSHRATLVPEVNREEYVEELVDALKLLFEVMIVSGINREELCAAYTKKHVTNLHRIENGY